ncbi:MAG TPA: sigma-70 family RNA polymerase sigma factor [Polyangiaceae bacterium]
MSVTAAPERVDTFALPTFADVFREHTRYLWRALLGLGVRPADVDDACQEVLLVVHRRLPEFDGRSLRSWLYAICLRVASDYRRSARVRHEVAVPEIPDSALPPGQHDSAESRELWGRLLSALDELDEQRRGAFVLYEIEELTLREVAEALKCPLQTAYSRLQSARDHVRVRFESARGAP